MAERYRAHDFVKDRLAASADISKMNVLASLGVTKLLDHPSAIQDLLLTTPRDNVQSRDWDELMLSALSGNEASYRQLLTEITPLLRRFARNGLARAGKGNLDVEDIVQETLLAVHLKRQSWDQSRTFAAWLQAIAKNKLIDALRRGGARVMLDIAEFDEALAAPEADATTGGDVDRLVTLLPAAQQRIVRDISMNGRSISETAAALGMQEGTCRVALHRALKKLAELYRGTSS